jgi:cytochrome c
MKRARIAFALGSLPVLSLVLSFIHPWGNPRAGAQPGAPLLEGGSVPDDVRRVLTTKCGDCHSQNTRYPVYSYLAPVSWMIEHDVEEARGHMNLSRWQWLSDADRISALSRMASEVNAGEMPPKRYRMLHPEARFSAEEQKLIYDWARAERKRLRQDAAAHRSDESNLETRQGTP